LNDNQKYSKGEKMKQIKRKEINWKESKDKQKNGLCNNKSVKIFFPALILMLNLASALDFLFKGFKDLFKGLFKGLKYWSEGLFRLLNNSINLKNKKEKNINNQLMQNKNKEIKGSHSLVIAREPLGLRLYRIISNNDYINFMVLIGKDCRGRIAWLLREVEDLWVYALQGSNFRNEMRIPASASPKDSSSSIINFNPTYPCPPTSTNVGKSTSNILFNKLKRFIKVTLTTAYSAIKLIDHLKMHKSISSIECAKIFGVSQRQAREDLSKMVLLRLLIKEGKARLTRYKLYPEVSG